MNKISGLQVGIGVTILAVVGFAAWYIIRQTKALMDNKIDFKSGKITFLGIKRIDFSMVFTIPNKSDVDITIVQQRYGVYINDVLISNVASNNIIKIPAQGSGDFTIDATFNPLQVLKMSLMNISDILANRKNIRVKIEGSVSAGSGGIILKDIPIKYETNLDELVAEYSK